MTCKSRWPPNPLLERVFLPSQTPSADEVKWFQMLLLTSFGSDLLTEKFQTMLLLTHLSISNLPKVLLPTRLLLTLVSVFVFPTCWLDRFNRPLGPIGVFQPAIEIFVSQILLSVYLSFNPCRPIQIRYFYPILYLPPYPAWYGWVNFRLILLPIVFRHVWSPVPNPMRIIANRVPDSSFPVHTLLLGWKTPE